MSPFTSIEIDTSRQIDIFRTPWPAPAKGVKPAVAKTGGCGTMSELVKTADAGHVRTITLNRPEKKNALSNALAWGVVEAIDAAARDDNVWVVALTGSGDAFCAGL